MSCPHCELLNIPSIGAPTALQTASAQFILVPATRELRMGNSEFLVEFKSLASRIYFVQYSSDLQSWKTAWPSMTGSGNQVQWIDNGPPRTESAPAGELRRFYRILVAP